MWSFLEQAGAARQFACEIRRHVPDVHAVDMATALKTAERLEARAAELEYRWLTLPDRPATAKSFGRFRFVYHRGP